MLVLACAMCALFSQGIATDSTQGLLASSRPLAYAQLDAPPVGPFDYLAAARADELLLPEERRHLSNVRQLTFGHSAGNEQLPNPANFAEAYWSPDGTKLVLQATFDEHACDQLFTLDIVTGALELVSTGQGRVTCGFYTADGNLIYSSTHEHGGPECPPRPDMSRGYVWPLYDSYDIYLSTPDAGGILRNLTSSPGYDAEGTIDWNTGWLYFTSTRDGDIDIYRQHLDSGAVERLTDEFGYDGGPFISYDGATVVYRRQGFAEESERADYSALLATGLVRPSRMELWAMNADGSDKRALTALGGANFAPFLHPDNETLVFCSNMADPRGRAFDLYTIPLSSSADAPAEPTRITHWPDFDGFPMFSPDGRYIVWCSNRNGGRAGETNVFVAEWTP